jgi:hypothetical protein
MNISREQFARQTRRLTSRPQPSRLPLSEPSWLRSQITRIEQQLANSTEPLLEEYDELSKRAET